MAKKPRGCFNGKWFPLNKMASVTVFPFSPLTSRQHTLRRRVIFRQAIRRKTFILRSNGKTSATGSSTDRDSESEKKNVLLKLAWYSSELLGIAASIVRTPANVESQGREVELAGDELGVVDQAQVVKIIKEDFKRSYFVTGNLALNAYEEDCEFADPAASFRGLRRFKRNCTNFGSLIKKSKMDLMKWEDFEDKGIGHWRFSCILLLPWRPILSATGYTEFYFDPQSGRVCRHVEHWNVPKMALLKQIFRPTRWIWDNKTGA